MLALVGPVIAVGSMVTLVGLVVGWWSRTFLWARGTGAVWLGLLLWWLVTATPLDAFDLSLAAVALHLLATLLLGMGAVRLLGDKG